MPHSTSSSQTQSLLIGAIIAHMPPVAGANADFLAELFVSDVVAGVKERPRPLHEPFSIIKMKHSFSDVASEKIENITINWKKVVYSTPNLGLAAAGAVANVWLMCLAGLALIAQLHDCTEVRLEREHGMIAFTLVKIQPATLAMLGKAFRKEFPDHSLPESRLEKLVDDLLRISAISEDNRLLRLIERIELRPS